MASTFTSALVSEIRVYDNPKNPGSSGYKVILPMTTVDAVTDPNTGETVEELLSAKQSASEKGAPNGYAGLDEDGKVPAEQLPAMAFVPTTEAITAIAYAASEAAALALSQDQTTTLVFYPAN
jgi:hypothetical protein